MDDLNSIGFDQTTPNPAFETRPPSAAAQRERWALKPAVLPPKETVMRYFAMLFTAALVFSLGASAADSQQTNAPPQTQTPSDYILLTVFLRHDQSRTFEEILKRLDDTQFWKQFPPPGIEIESWYVMMGVGHVITLRVPPARLREVNLSVEKTVWGVFKTDFYATYDYREVARQRREKALQAQ
jgi:hypothetical protein